MASVRRLKKNVASVLGELVETLIIWEFLQKIKELSTNNFLKILKEK